MPHWKVENVQILELEYLAESQFSRFFLWHWTNGFTLLRLGFLVFKVHSNPYLIGLQGGLNKVVNVKCPRAGQSQQRAALWDWLLLLTCQQGLSWPGEAARALKGWLLKQSGLNMILQVLLRDELQGNSCVVLLGNQGLSVIWSPLKKNLKLVTDATEQCV